MFDFVGDIVGGLGDTVGDLFGGASDLLGGDFLSGGLGGLIGDVAKAGLSALMAPTSPTGGSRGAGLRDETQRFGPAQMADARFAQGVRSEDPDQVYNYWLRKMQSYSQVATNA